MERCWCTGDELGLSGESCIKPDFDGESRMTVTLWNAHYA